MVQVGMPTQKACLLELSPAASPQMTDKPNVLLLFMLRPLESSLIIYLRDIYVHDPSPLGHAEDSVHGLLTPSPQVQARELGKGPLDLPE